MKNEYDNSFHSLVQVRLMGIARREGEQIATALLMQEVDGSRMFPVFIPDELIAYYTSTIQRHTISGTVENDVIDRMMDALGVHIRKVSIILRDSGKVCAELLAVGEYGHVYSFTAPMHQAIFYAYVRNLPLFAEEKFLEMVSDKLKVNLTTSTMEMIKDGMVNKLKDGLAGEYLTKRLTPNDIGEAAVQDFLDSMSYNELELFLELTVEQELYEWSQVLQQELKLRDEEVQEMIDKRAKEDE